jgi:hypothetical protein
MDSIDLTEIDDLLENIQRLENTNKALDTLERIGDKYPSLIKVEEEYQLYCLQFSKAYLSGSEYYVGDSFVEALISKKSLGSLFGGIFCALFVQNSLKNHIR